ncbi:YmaF family protein [Paenibacillus marinisediminis]
MKNRSHKSASSKKLSSGMRESSTFRTNRFQHRMSGNTSFNFGHRHRFDNFTKRFIQGIGTHRHTFDGFTQIALRHRHFFSGITGPAINGQGARHFHRFRVFTRFADGHRHLMSGRTSVPIKVSGSTRHKHGIIIESIKRI